MRIVITGGGGFLGSRLARKLLERNTLTDASGRAREIESITLLDVVPAALPGDARVTVDRRRPWRCGHARAGDAARAPTASSISPRW